MKNLIAVALIIIAFLGGYFVSQKYNFKIETKTQLPTPTGEFKNVEPTTETQINPTIKPDENDGEKIKAALVKKHSWNSDDIIVTVSENDGQFARGGVKEKSSEVGGGMFLAVKKNGEWEIVFDGNGTVDCQMIKSTYQFPLSMLKGICD